MTVFLSDLFFRNPVNRHTPYLPPQSRTFVRGLLIEKFETDVSRALQFQFNPTKISDSKVQNYFERIRTGIATPDSVWVSGAPSTLKFELFLDATADSNTPHFQKKTSYGKETYDTLSSVDGINLIEYGTLPQVERLKQFYYPVQKEAKPRFVNNSSVAQNNASRASDQFIPPPILIFTYGPIYLEVKMTSLDIEHELFNSKLAPIRTRASVTLTVKEEVNVNTSVPILSQQGTPMGPPTNPFSVSGGLQRFPNSGK